MEPKLPEDIYKSHLEPSRKLELLLRSRGFHEIILGPFGGAGQIDSARQNLASTFVNGFVNAGFGADKMMADDANKWFYKNKDHGTFFLAWIRKIGVSFLGMMSAAASQGLLYRWDIDHGLNQIDKFLYVTEDFIKVSPSQY